MKIDAALSALLNAALGALLETLSWMPTLLVAASNGG
jgi:hypothetical protein